LAGPVDMALDCNELPAFRARCCGKMEAGRADRCGGMGGDRLGDDKPLQPKTTRNRLRRIKETIACKSLTRYMDHFNERRVRERSEES
jgi:hypothetical protein